MDNSEFEIKLRRGRNVLRYLNARDNRNLLDNKGREWVGKNYFQLELNEISSASGRLFSKKQGACTVLLAI